MKSKNYSDKLLSKLSHIKLVKYKQKKNIVIFSRHHINSTIRQVILAKCFNKLLTLFEGVRTMKRVSLEVNGKKFSKDIPDHTLLSVFLRDILNLTGTHVGCDTSQCGACVVHIDGKSIKSCTAFAADLDGSKVTTIEGLAQNGKMHPMQEAFKKLHGLQCGFCTPGMVMSAIDLLQNNKKPSDTEIREWLEGNICRCTGYQNIVAAVKEAASKM